MTIAPQRPDRDAPAAAPELALLQARCASLMLRCEQLETALRSRVIIEQAKGVLCERLRIAPDEAFGILRRGARSHRLRIHELATKVVASRETPPELDWPSSAGDAA